MKTVRQQIIECLSNGPMNGLELSKAVGIMERAVYEHLPHVAKTMSVSEKRLIVHPSECLDCSFIFRDRRRYKAPGRCPRCKSTYLRAPAYEIK